MRNQSGKFLSDIIGAHDLSDFVMQVETYSPTGPTIDRGGVVCRLANGHVTLAGAEETTPDDVYGILLDFGFTPESEAEPKSVSIARSGVYAADQLSVDPSTNLRAFEEALRGKGIFLEKLALTPEAPETETETAHHK